MQRFRLISTTGDRKVGTGVLRTPALYVRCFVLDRNKKDKKIIRVKSGPNQSLHPDFSFFLGSECHPRIDVFVPPRTTSVLHPLANLDLTFVPGLWCLVRAMGTHE